MSGVSGIRVGSNAHAPIPLTAECLMCMRRRNSSHRFRARKSGLVGEGRLEKASELYPGEQDAEYSWLGMVRGQQASLLAASPLGKVAEGNLYAFLRDTRWDYFPLQKACEGCGCKKHERLLS